MARTAEGPGNGRLVELGAVPVASAAEVLGCLDREPVAVAVLEQLSLWD